MERRVDCINFGALQFLLQIPRDEREHIILELSQAELIFEVAPGPSIASCRKSVELLAKSCERLYGVAAFPTNSGGYKDRLRALVSNCRSRRRTQAADAWQLLLDQYGPWSQVVHGDHRPSSAEVLSAMRILHHAVGQIVADHCPTVKLSPFRTPKGIHGHLADLDEKLKTERSLHEKARQEAARVGGERDDLRTKLQETATQLQGAYEEVDELRKRQAAGDRSAALRELLSASEAQVKLLTSRERELLDEQARRDSIIDAANANERAHAEREEQYEAERSRLIAELEKQRARIDEVQGYEESYPSSPFEVPEFLAGRLHRACPLPPFERVTNPSRLEGDPFFDRFEASRDLQSVTVRIRGMRPGSADDVTLSAWDSESRNVERLRTSSALMAREGIARILVWEDPSRPGFSVFARRPGPLLSDFGREGESGARGRTVGLVMAATAAVSILDELEARDRAGLFVSWPDARSVAVHGGRVSLLDPPACHFGDLGPMEFMSRPPEDVRFMSESSLASAHAFVIAHAFGKLVGMLPVGARPDSSPAERWVVDRLRDLRRDVEDRPIQVSSVTRLGATLAAALHSDERSRPSAAALRMDLESLLQPGS